MLPEQTKRRRFDVGQYHRMLEAGILSEDDRVELIDGEIVEMTPAGGRHVHSVNRLTMALAPAAARAGMVLSVQNPLVLDDNGEPEPDLVLLKDESKSQGSSEEPAVPSASEALLVVEVSESSLSWDRNVKVPRYARASIPEVWIVDLASGVLEVYTEPDSSGHYRKVKTLSGEEELRAGTLGALGSRVRDIL
jgi:Uma2 family endonuclease